MNNALPKLWSLPGGIHPPENKSQSLNGPIRMAALPPQLTVPVTQPDYATPQLCVQVGDRVHKGQALVRAAQSSGLLAHAPDKLFAHLDAITAIPQNETALNDPDRAIAYFTAQLTSYQNAAYAARYLAKNVVAAGLADRCTLQLSYAIGVARPLSIYVDTHGTGNADPAAIERAIDKVMNLTPRGIRTHLGLNRPIYARTSAYGHFGRKPEDDGGFSWEKTDLAEALAKAV